jgi:predicted ATPase/DNA-binding XRE family transcriptional regulator
MDTVPPVTFGDLLRRFRLAAGLTQEELAERAQISPRAISDLERGLRSRPWRDTIQFLAEALKLDAGERAQLEGAARRPAAPPAESPEPSADSVIVGARTNLPEQTTSFVGRETEIAEIRRLLLDPSPAARLITLTGAGGCGKTRLALQVASGIVDHFPDGVWLVELAPLTDPVLVAQTVALTLGIREMSGVPLLRTLAERLRSLRLLLVLDNCEHLIDASAQLADTLIRSCPHVRILATSRELLGVAGENARQVHPLTAPDLRAAPANAPDLVSYVRQHDAARLFVERARLVVPTFDLTTQNAPFVAQICQRLDGIPLAIELAAARLRVLPVEQIAARLSDRFRLLTGGSRTALRRQQTLRALIDWSYDALSAAEQSLLRRLSVFAGGWTLEAAEAVCGDVGTIPQGDVFELLTHLVDKSLVVGDERGGVAWFWLLETIRQYLGEKLLEAGESEGARHRHADWCQSLVAHVRYGDIDRATGDRIELQHDNLRAALEWYLEADPAKGLVLAYSICPFWITRGYTVEARRWLQSFLERVPDRTVLRSRALGTAAVCAWDEGEYTSARRLSEDALRIARETGYHDETLWDALICLAQLEWTEGNLSPARALLAEAWTDIRDRHDSFVLFPLIFLAALDWLDGALDQALLKNKQAIELLRVGRSFSWNGWGLVQRAGLLRLVGDTSQVEPLLNEALALFQDLGDRSGIGMTTGLLGYLAGLAGDQPKADRLLRQSLRLLRDIGHRSRIAACLSLLGILQVRRGDIAAGTRLLALATPIHRNQDSARHPWFRDDIESTLRLARSQLGEAGFSAEWAKGQQLPLEQAIGDALKDGGDRPWNG